MIDIADLLARGATAFVYPITYLISRLRGGHGEPDPSVIEEERQDLEFIPINYGDHGCTVEIVNNTDSIASISNIKMARGSDILETVDYYLDIKPRTSIFHHSSMTPPNLHVIAYYVVDNTSKSQSFCFKGDEIDV